MRKQFAALSVFREKDSHIRLYFFNAEKGLKIWQTQKQKVKEITDKLGKGLKELFESEKYKSYLFTMSKFNNYSLNNTLLIALQCPDASLVAGYQTWQKNFNRHVNKGEKGIRILAPYKIKVLV